MTYNLFIGSDNRTKRLNVSKIEQIMSDRHEGFTLYPVTGYWHGQQEHSMLVIVNDDNDKIKQTISILKQELVQEAIGYQIVPDMQFA